MSNQNTSNNLLFVGSANSSNIAGNGKELSSNNQPNPVNNNQHASGIGTFKFKCFGFVMGLTLYNTTQWSYSILICISILMTYDYGSHDWRKAWYKEGFGS